MPASALGVIHVQGDVTNDARMREIVEQASGKQSLDFLVNNAGITKKCRAEDFPAEDFAHILQVNIHSVFRLCQLCYPYLKNSRHKGRIVSRC